MQRRRGGRPDPGCTHATALAAPLHHDPLPPSGVRPSGVLWQERRPVPRPASEVSLAAPRIRCAVVLIALAAALACTPTLRAWNPFERVGTRSDTRGDTSIGPDGAAPRAPGTTRGTEAPGSDPAAARPAEARTAPSTPEDSESGPGLSTDSILTPRAKPDASIRPRALAERKGGSNSPVLLLRGAHVLTAAGQSLERGDVLIEGERIAAVAPEITPPVGARTLDLSGRWITPGLIDPHSHLGVAPVPNLRAQSDANELTGPIQPALRARDAFWPQDPALRSAAAGGVTLIHVLPGSGNIIGGQGVSLHVRPSLDGDIRALEVPDAPTTLKLACGENPKRAYGARGSAPASRMGIEAALRQALEDARAYAPEKNAPRQLQAEVLQRVLAGEILIQNHCYRADEMQRRIELFDEFGIRPRAFHHAVEAYKMADVLAAQDIAVVLWADWWGRKLEMLDAIPAGAALLDRAGVRVALHSDSPDDIQRLNQQAARALAAGRRAGIEIDRDRALRWITRNPAWVLGIEDRYGSIEVGKHADLAVWSGDPFSVYSRAELVFSDGQLIFDRADPERFPVSDFEIGSEAARRDAAEAAKRRERATP